MEGIYCTLDELFLEGSKTKKQNLHLLPHPRAQTGNGRRSGMRGRGMEFYESRPYVAQDEIRHIDWKVSARLHGVFTKVFIEEKERPIYLVVDQRSSMFFGTKNCFKSVLAAKLAARLAFLSINGGDKVGGLIIKDTNEVECKMARSKKGLAYFLGALTEASKKALSIEDLANKKEDESSRWIKIFSHLVASVHPGSVIFLLSDFLGIDEQIQPFLYQLKKRADIYPLAISDPLEEELPNIGLVGMCYGQEKIALNTADKKLRKEYQTINKNKKDLVAKLFNSLNIPLFYFVTAEDYNNKLSSIIHSKWRL